MLLQVTSTNLEQRCDVCGARRLVAFTDILAGLEGGDPPEPLDPNIIALPVCTDCGAREFLNRVPASEPSASRDAGEHRRAVNALHEALIEAGRASPTLEAYFATETLEVERAELPWSATFEPRPLAQLTDPSGRMFADYVAARRGGA